MRMIAQAEVEDITCLAGRLTCSKICKWYLDICIEQLRNDKKDIPALKWFIMIYYDYSDTGNIGRRTISVSIPK